MFDEVNEWVCQDLETLRVKVQELTSWALIDIHLTKLKDLRNSPGWRPTGMVEVEGRTAGDRVIKKLTGLHGLNIVCLSTNDVFLATRN